jgi:pimeloyl-ACP methyl ester carboxylesterase
MDHLKPGYPLGDGMISDKIEARQLITLGADGVLVRGTYHEVPRKAQEGSNAQGKNVGVVFLNPLSTPRTLIGDSAVFWASSFAAQGYPSLRLDLPGLGDSYGEAANDLVTFINEAGFASITASKIREFAKTFGLSGVVIYGHCAGAVTAVFAASECQECKGLIITDPYFNAANMLTPKLSPGMVDWARRSKVGEMLRATYGRIREARKKQDNGALPGNANVRLVTHWKKLASSGLPILVFKSGEPAALGSAKLRAGSFDYLEHITSFAGNRSQLSIKTIEGTNHSFADRVGRAAIREHAEAWLNENFPLPNAQTPVLANLEFSKAATDADTAAMTPGQIPPGLVAHKKYGSNGTATAQGLQ